MPAVTHAGGGFMILAGFSATGLWILAVTETTINSTQNIIEINVRLSVLRF